MATHNTDITTAFGTTSGTFASQTVLAMNFSLLKTEMQSMGTDLDDLMSRVAFFDTRTEASAATIDTTVGAVILCGYTTLGDMAPALFKKDSTPSHNGYFTSNGGTLSWVYIPGPEGVDARAFGFLEAGTAAANATALTNWSGFLNAGNFQKGVVPAGIYSLGVGSTTVDGASVNVALTRSDIHITMHGAKFEHNVAAGTEAIVFDLNANATATESSITSRIKLSGGHILHSTAYATTANNLTGVRIRGDTRVVVEGMWLEDLHVGIICNPRDAVTIRECNGFQNGKHVWCEDYQTTTDNPQNVDILSCRWGLHYDKGIHLEGNASMMHIDMNYFIGEWAIVIENGSSQAANFNNDNVNIDRCDFEQGTLVTLTGSWTLGTGSATITAPGLDGAATTELVAGDRIETAGGNVYTVSSITDDDTIVLTANPTANESTVTIYQARPYIDVRDTNSRTLVGLNIERCKFSAFDGVTTAAHVLHLRDVTGWTFAKCNVAGRAPGWIWADSACTEGHYGPVTKTGTANLIHFDCGREDISCTPAVIDFPAYNGGNGNLIHNNAAVSDGDSATIDMSATVGAAYWPDDIPPKGYDLAIGARDSASAAAAAGAAYLSILPTSATAAGERFRYLTVELAGMTDDRYLTAQGYVPADDNGDIYVLINATGTSTLDAYATIKRMWM